MRNIYVHIVLALAVVACNSKPVEKPIWINQAAILSIPADSIIFTAKGKSWDAALMSFTQSVPLKVKFTDNGFIVSQKNRWGVTEGPAQLILSNGEHNFYYDINLLNKDYSVIGDKDYRSPKTVNPDSSLKLHRMIHSTDHWRNLLYNHQKQNYFYEEILGLRPIAGTFRAQKDKALSAFYVQPGSCTSINVKSAFLKDEKVYEVTAGPLKDKYNNTVADGTSVAFIYHDGIRHYRMEAALLNGYTSVRIPAFEKQQYSIIARVNETVSETVQLVP